MNDRQISTVGVNMFLRFPVAHHNNLKQTSHFYVEIYQSAEDIKATQTIWKALEENAVMTPYQQFSWCRTWYNTVSSHIKEKPFIIVIKNNNNDPIALFPLAVRTSLFFTCAYFIGLSHSNYNMGIFTQEAYRTLTAGALREIFRQIAKQAQIDCFLFANQPSGWARCKNPLTQLGGTPSPSPAYSALLPQNADEFFHIHYHTRHKRKRFRYKQRNLAALGDYQFHRAATFMEKKEILDTFLQHKKSWFFDRGINNPFSPSWIKEFFVTLTAYEDSPLEFYALRSPEHIASIFCVSVNAGRMSGLFTSIDLESETARHSPGELLLFYLMQSGCARGLESFDLGIGEASYKESFCPIEDILTDYALPVTIKGHCFTLGWGAWRKTKGWIKRHPRIFTTVKQISGKSREIASRLRKQAVTLPEK